MREGRRWRPTYTPHTSPLLIYHQYALMVGR
jgi:hypothetical protein